MVTELGIVYEVLFYDVLLEAKRRGVFKGEVFWHERPNGINVVPDFLIGKNKDVPDFVFMVSHLGTSKESEKKGWRNLGELCEAKTTLTRPFMAIDVVFEAGIKPGVLAIQKSCFDAVLIVEGKPYAAQLFAWAHEHSSKLPSDQVLMASELLVLSKTDKVLSHIISNLIVDLKTVLSVKQNPLSQLWAMDMKRIRGVVPRSRVSFFRRGFVKRILVDEALVGGSVRKEDAKWLMQLGLVGKIVSGYSIADSELRRFLATKYADKYKEIAHPFRTVGFEEQLAKVRNFFLFDYYTEYVLANLANLKTKAGMQDTLLKQWKDPAVGLRLPTKMPGPNTVWIYSYIASLICAKQRHGQAFGYSAFAKHPKGQVAYTDSITLGAWCARFACEFFNRKKDFNMPRSALKLVSTVLSDALKDFSEQGIKELKSEIFLKFVHKEYEVNLLSHKGFDPLSAILVWEGVCEKAQLRKIQSCFSKRAGLPANVGTIDAFWVNGVVIRVQSANHLKHSTDKRKELCGRAFGLRYDWNQLRKCFELRKGIKKLILLLDGEWSIDHIASLIAAGWDEIYYPDEIDKLKASVLGTKGKARPLEPTMGKSTDEYEELPMAAEDAKEYGKKK